MGSAVILSATRTAIGSLGGSLASLNAVKLGTAVIREALLRAGISPGEVDEVIMGNVLQAGLGQNTARQASLSAGIPVDIPAFTVNKVCASGLKAVTIAAQSIMTGECDLVVAGGMEHMSGAPYLLMKARSGYRLGDGELVDSLVRDGVWDAINDYHMGITAENVVDQWGISRMEQDTFAVESQIKTARAMEEGLFDEEITAVEVPQRKGASLFFKKDEFPKPGTTLEALARLRPAFKENGTVTAGNSSGLNDGAAALVLASEDKARNLGIKPLAKITAWASAGVDPATMGIGPAAATHKLIKKNGLTLRDFDLIEANEAFAAQAIAVNREIGWDISRVNVNGGAIALGHPIGATGARILVTLIHEMTRREVKSGIATLCIGGGMGMACLLERA